ncbi:GNAT family N-acetyltransferase [Arthrobacter sp. MMS24-S77]
MDGMTWRLCWEADISQKEHARLSGLLARIYPDHQATFSNGRSWSGARPEGRLIGYDGRKPVAHLGFLRRMLRVESQTSAVHVADVGLVGTDPDYRGTGVGIRLLNEASASFHQFHMPFGFLTCRPAVVSFYERAGWLRLPGQITRMITNDGEPEKYNGPALVLPLLAELSDWPMGHIVIRDGLEV